MENRSVGFRDLALYYCNVVDYVRVILLIIALFCLFNHPLLTAAAIILAALLDWVDGPLARAFKQCSLFGEGLDWFADVLVALLLLCWLASLKSYIFPWFGLFTFIEMLLSILEVCAKGSKRHVHYNDAKFNFKIILYYCIPNGRFSHFGTFLWLALPVTMVIYCLCLTYNYYLSPLIWAILFIPSVLYFWLEATLLIHNITNWTEESN